MDVTRRAPAPARLIEGGLPTEATPGPSPIASEALEHVAALYAIEKDIRGCHADERREHLPPRWL
jgi:hypothetical protein